MSYALIIYARYHKSLRFRSHFIVQEIRFEIAQIAANLAIKLTPNFRSFINIIALCNLDPSLPRQKHPCRWLWEARNPRRRVWIAWAGGTRSPSGHAGASFPASVAPRDPHPWGTPRASPASASARCAALSDCCNSSPTLPAKRVRNAPINYIIIASNPHDIVIILLLSRELDVTRSIMFYLVYNKNHFRWLSQQLARLLRLPRSSLHSPSRDTLVPMLFLRQKFTKIAEFSRVSHCWAPFQI